MKPACFPLALWLLGMLPGGAVLAQGGQNIDHYIGCSDHVPFKDHLISDPATVEIGGLLTPWVQLDSERQCGAWAYAGGAPVMVGRMWAQELVLRLAPGVELAGTAPVMADGQAHSVYKLPLPGLEGIGYVMKVQRYEHNVGTLWEAVNLAPGELKATSGFDWSFEYQPPEESPLETLRASFQVALVKTGEIGQWPLPGFEFIDFPALQHNARMQIAVADADDDAAPLTPLAAVDDWQEMWFNSTTQEHAPPGDGGVPTCTTPDITWVVLDTAHTDEFSGPGSVAREQAFVLEWDCTHTGWTDDGPPPTPMPWSGPVKPMGAGAGVGYEFHVNGGQPSPDAAQGLLPLMAPSVARGVAVQVLIDDDGSSPAFPSGDYAPIEFGVVKPLHLSGPELEFERQVYRLPLKARYYQTATDTGEDFIAPGKVYAGLRVLIVQP